MLTSYWQSCRNLWPFSIAETKIVLWFVEIKWSFKKLRLKDAIFLCHKNDEKVNDFSQFTNQMRKLPFLNARQYAEPEF